MRSRADPSRDDLLSRFRGRLYGMTVWGNYGMTPLHVTGVLLPRISVFREKRDRLKDNRQSLFSLSSSRERSELS